MKTVKSFLELDLIQVDWKNIININKNRIGDKSQSKENNEELNILFI